jgi:hypothetical protein
MKLLSIDGAIGAPLSLRLLHATEKLRPGFIEKADMIVGASSGAAVAAYLAIHLGKHHEHNLAVLKRATDLADDLLRAIHASLGNVAWFASGLGSFLSPCAFEDVIAPYFPDSWTLGRMEQEQKRLLLALALATEWRARYMFRSFNFDKRYGDVDRAVRVRDAVLASSALPLVLPQRRVTVGDRYKKHGAVTLSFVDGSVSGNNPSAYALHRALTYLQSIDDPPKPQPRDYLPDVVILSFGPRNVLPPISDAPAGWRCRFGAGWISYAMNLVSSALFPLDIQEDVADVTCRALLDHAYFRVDPVLMESLAAWKTLLCGADAAIAMMAKLAENIVAQWERGHDYLPWICHTWDKPTLGDGIWVRADRYEDPGRDIYS